MHKHFPVFFISVLISSLAIISAVWSECKLPIPDVYERVSPSVVIISAFRIDPFRLEERFDISTGTGIVIDTDGLVLTSAHVVHEAKAVIVTIDEGQMVDASIVGEDPIVDVAVLRIQEPVRGLNAAAFADSDRLRVGEEVIAIGTPLGIEKTLVRGIISGLNRILPVSPISIKIPLIQTDADIYPGNSGGPLIDRCGKVVGIVTSMLKGEANMGFAVPVNVIKKVLPQLIDSGRVIRPWIGVHGKLISAEELQRILNADIIDGYLVEAVEPASPAEIAGLQGGDLPIVIAGEEFLMGGDIIYEINGQPLRDPVQLDNFLDSLKIGDTIRFSVYRAGKRSEVELAVSERPPPPGRFPDQGN